MANTATGESTSTSGTASTKAAAEKPKERRSIPGNFSYTTTPGKLKIALEKIIEAERPDVFNKNFLETYLTVSGGSAAPIPNILKRVGFISGEGRPTDLYARFHTEGGRAEAALEGLKAGFGELFKKNTFAHSAPEEKIKDLLVEITGLKKTDTVLSLIYGTFDAFRSFVPAKFVSSGQSSGPSKKMNKNKPRRAMAQGLRILGCHTISTSSSPKLKMWQCLMRFFRALNRIF